MRVYGFECCDVQRGEIRGAIVDKIDIDLGYPDGIKARLDWEGVSTSFNDAKRQLLTAMEEEGVDEETIAVTRQIKRDHILF